MRKYSISLLCSIFSLICNISSLSVKPERNPKKEKAKSKQQFTLNGLLQCMTAQSLSL